ncbi:hypothetical protein ABT009_03360 [Streptomyces sp. NPDC002896]|uniref:hypothetical protein n=1 Tax=Streptomyces sp. NPDC002896 TaxID=3154438 RepID=UPI00332085F9
MPASRYCARARASARIAWAGACFRQWAKAGVPAGWADAARGLVAPRIPGARAPTLDAAPAATAQ